MVFTQCPACSSSIELEDEARLNSQIECPTCRTTFLALAATCPELGAPELDDEDFSPDFDETKEWRQQLGIAGQGPPALPLPDATAAVPQKTVQGTTAARSRGLRPQFWIGVLSGAVASLIVAGATWRLAHKPNALASTESQTLPAREMTATTSPLTASTPATVPSEPLAPDKSQTAGDKLKVNISSFGSEWLVAGEYELEVRGDTAAIVVDFVTSRLYRPEASTRHIKQLVVETISIAIVDASSLPGPHGWTLISESEPYRVERELKGGEECQLDKFQLVIPRRELFDFSKKRLTVNLVVRNGTSRLFLPSHSGELEKITGVATGTNVVEPTRGKKPQFAFDASSSAPRSPAARTVTNDLFGFPQAEATVLCDDEDLRLSAWNDAQYLYVQAILWGDFDDRSGESAPGQATGDRSFLLLDVDANQRPTPQVDRQYALNTSPPSRGLYFGVLGGNGKLAIDPGSKGAVRYANASDGRRVRVDNFLIPLAGLGKRPGETIRLAYWGVSPQPELKLNSVGYVPAIPNSYYPHHLSLNQYHAVRLVGGASLIDISKVPDDREPPAASKVER